MSASYESEMWMMTVGGLLIAFLGLCCKYCYKIKIADCNLCFGVISLRRNIEEEVKADEENQSDDTIPMPQLPLRRGALQSRI
jgi:hypothetical protein